MRLGVVVVLACGVTLLRAVLFHTATPILAMGPDHRTADRTLPEQRELLRSPPAVAAAGTSRSPARSEVA